MASKNQTVTWQHVSVASPHLNEAVNVIVAKDIPIESSANRLQNFSIYTPITPSTKALLGTAATSLPSSDVSSSSGLPHYHVHIHGGAWRDPNLGSFSIEAAVAHAFSDAGSGVHLDAVISLNYTLSPFPTHPNQPYNPAAGDTGDPAREAQHPMHIHDILTAFSKLRELRLNDGDFILSGHSAGACLAFQATLASPLHWGVPDVTSIPRPAVLLGMNGLYHLPDLVHGLGLTHEHLKDDYEGFLGLAFGTDQGKWPAASPAMFSTESVLARGKEGQLPGLIIVDQSHEDQLVPMNQMESMKRKLEETVRLGCEMMVVRGSICVGVHAAPWEQGIIIWEEIKDIFEMLSKA